MRSLTLIFLFLIYSFAGYSQGFQNVSSLYTIQLYNNGPLYGGGVSFCDFNGDGLDDLTFCLNNDSVTFYVNNGNGFNKMELIGNIADAKQPTWVDYDNDGDRDLFITKRGASCKLYRNDGFPILTDVTVSMNLPTVVSYNTYGCSWGDYDNDSFLDVYICNYNWLDGVTNWLMHNNGNGTFTNMGYALGVDNGSKPSFQSVWIDFNFDGWQDLYLVNDKYQVNAMYQNNGNGTFTNAGSTTSSNVALDSMSNSISDYDHDGDFDIYISNTASAGNFLLRNDDGVFQNVAESAGVEANMLCWGSLFIDYNNDGWDDIHVTTVDIQNGNQNYFYINQQDGTFIESSSSVGLASDDYNSYSNARGDFNNDGYYDFIETNVIPTTSALWRNSGGSNHYLKLGLEGVVSNKDGVGTLVECWVNGEKLIRQTQCGGNYIAQDSQYEIFGLGTHIIVDTLILHWPSGWVDSFYNLEADQFFSVTEGDSFTAEISSDSEGICSGNSITLSVGEYEQYAWSTGAETPTLEIFEPGDYSVVVINEWGFEDLAEISISLIQAEVPEIITTQPSCYGSSDGIIELLSEPGIISSIEWDNNADSTFISGLEAGEYSYTLLDSSGCYVSETVELNQPLPLNVSSEVSLVSCYGGNNALAELFISGGVAPYMVNWQGANPDSLPAGDYVVLISDSNFCSISDTIYVDQSTLIDPNIIVDSPCYGENGSVSVSVSGGNGPYNFDWNGVDSLSVSPGEYVLTVQDQLGCEVNEDYIVQELQEIIAEVQVVHANNGDNGSSMITVSGGTPPYDFLWDTGSESQVASNLGQGIYYCIVTDWLGCSISVEVVIIDLEADEISNDGILLFPNPAEDLIEFNPMGSPWRIESISGQLLLTGKNQSSQWQHADVSSFEPGVYLLRVGERCVLFEKR